MLIGYATKQKAYKLRNDVNQEEVVLSDVLFVKSAANFKNCNELTPTTDLDEHSSKATNSPSGNDSEDKNTTISVPNISEYSIVSTVQDKVNKTSSLLEKPDLSKTLHRSNPNLSRAKRVAKRPIGFISEVPEDKLLFSLAIKGGKKDK